MATRTHPDKTIAVASNPELIADELNRVQPDAKVTVLCDGEVAVRTKQVVLRRFFEIVRQNGYEVLEMYPTIGDTKATEIVVKPA